MVTDEEVERFAQRMLWSQVDEEGKSGVRQMARLALELMEPEPKSLMDIILGEKYGN